MRAAGSHARRRRTAQPPGEVHVDRLALRVAGLDDRGAHALARLVADGLGTALLQAPATSRLGSLHVQVAADGADQGDPDLIARQIVRGVGQMLSREQASGRFDGGAAR